MVVSSEKDLLEKHQKLLAEYSAVQQAMSELTAIYNDAPIGMAVIGTDFRFQRINARLAQINGASIEAHLGHTLREVIPKLAEFGETLMRKIVETGKSILNLEVEGETAAEPGVTRSFIAHWSPVKGPKGDVVAVNVVVEEVTAQKHAEQALRASEAHLREVLDSINDAFVVLDHDFRVIQMNRQALRLDGRDALEIIGLTHWEAWPPSVGTAVETTYRRVMTERVPLTLEHRYVDSAHDIWLDISAYPMSDGIALFYRDISERKRAEERLKESERRLSLAMRAGQLGVFEYGYGNSPVSYWDSALRGIWGVGEDVEINDDLFWSTVHPADVKDVVAAWRHAENFHGSHRFEVQHRIHRHIDGALRWVKVAADVVFDGNQPVKIIGTVQDITDRKTTEDQAQILMREVNHRSKNLLAVVQSIAHQMARGADPETFAKRFADRLAGLAASQDLLVQSQWNGVDLAELVTSQLAHYQHLIGVRIHVAGEPVRISASAAQNLGMAVHELATNAAKYGALSGDIGNVAIRWEVAAAGDAFTITWTESGGPAVTAPLRKGLGSLIITRLLETSLGGTYALRFDPGGLTWSLRAPVSTVVEAGREKSP